jgi:ribokinase
MAARIVVIGGFNMDLATYMERLPGPGETVLGERFAMGPGGKGSNQAIAAARLGAQVRFVGRVGRDSFGEAALKAWADHGVDAGLVTVDPDRPTGVASILVDARGENLIAVAPGANGALDPEQVDRALAAIGPVDLVVTGLEIPLPAAARALRTARARGLRTLLNPAPALPLPEAVLADADILTPNEGELQGLTAQLADGLEARAQALGRLGGQTVVVTLGARGAWYWADGACGRVPAFPVAAVDATGAGDAFTAGLAVALAEGAPVPEAVRFASAAAALCVTRTGAAASLPRREEVEAFLK